MQNKVLGAFSEYLLIPEHVVKQNTYKKPDRLSFDEAAILEPLSCVIHPYGFVSLLNVRTVLIIGAGPIGLLHALYLRSKGIHTIISDSNRERLDAANRVGSDDSTLPGGLMETVNERTEGAGVDLVVECTGKVEVWHDSINYVRRGGSIILFGGCKRGTSVQFDTHRLHYDEIALFGTFHFTPQDVASAYALLCSDGFDVKPLISDIAGLDQIGAVFEHLRNGRGIKYAIRP
jgi:L-iditol 2-dehydrogenase